MNLKVWLHSLAAAAIGGAATSLTAYLSTPQSFPNNVTGWEHIGSIALSGAILAVLTLLKTSPRDTNQKEKA